MPVEIEKKYRLSRKQRDEVRQRLPKIGAKRKSEEFEVNTLYAGNDLEVGRAVLRLRRIGKRGILTYKERFPTRSDIKHQREDETRVDNPEAMELILDALGFRAALVYEKHRETWTLKETARLKKPGTVRKSETSGNTNAVGTTEIVIDELPFGLFMEIEGTEENIRDIESKLAIKRLRAEPATYPKLTLKHGKDYDGVIEARFTKKK
jgi:adenylate cyclase class 2